MISMACLFQTNAQALYGMTFFKGRSPSYVHTLNNNDLLVLNDEGYSNFTKKNDIYIQNHI